jgi:hypothetical protein
LRRRWLRRGEGKGRGNGLHFWTSSGIMISLLATAHYIYSSVWKAPNLKTSGYSGLFKYVDVYRFYDRNV